MKKQIFIKAFLIAFVFAIAGCSGDDDSNALEVTQPQILIKKITEIINSNSSDKRTITFSYENGKLVSSTTTNANVATVYRSDFVYNGDKVEHVISYADNVERGRNTYIYDGDLLTKIVSNRVDQSQTKYSYTNGMLSYSESGYLMNETYTVSSTKNFIFAAGNLIEEQRFSADFGTPVTSKTTYTFDHKNNPTKFMNKSLRYVFSVEGFDGMSENNALSRLSYYPSTTTTPNLYTYQLVYDANDFPTEIKQFSPEGAVISLTKIEYQ
ncbi:hypothetical protein FNO01nite_06020 [Flavobacterium noncentrifugens]|uniref:YD repeat-containing protein n=1 Tax=Flavobacterium noncentrifugens TaxID=1128970 RepID=A0A1G8SQW9_9FLAO|nr:hypothetical protein [Flavobacterium noncentrifugens]GEP49930.1 hypothetical protein FNO01nite_06020 [Flavobacterium noncentrifugens]SDJ31607.1 hypothetical protein SAMN04487935_0662 [Flavobacterium noncentrifugens]